MIRVSVVVAAYNVAPYLSRCIESLLAQTESSIEVLIVNDGSTDETPEIANRFAEDDPRVMVIHQENSGLSVARNVGLSAARGSYVCFVDGDDWVDPMMAEKMYSLCDSTRAEVAVAGVFVDFHDESENLLYSRLRALPSHIIRLPEAVPAELFDENVINLLGYAWNKIYLRDWLLNLDEWFEEDLILIEDVDFNCRVLSNAEDIVFTPDAFVHYVQRPRPSLGTFRDARFISLSARAIESMDSLLSSWGVQDDFRRERRSRASASVLWAGINAAGRAPNRRYMLSQLLTSPGAGSLLVSVSLKTAGWRGAWATVTLRRGWYGIALFPAMTIKLLKHLFSFSPSFFVRNKIRRISGIKTVNN